jgi:filamin
MPSGNIDKPIIEDNRDGTVSVKYEPREEGLHELSVKYNGEHVQGELNVPKCLRLDKCNVSSFTSSGPTVSVEVFMVVKLLIVVFWVVMPCSLP